MIEAEIRASDLRELARVAGHLKGAPKEIRRELHKALQQSTKPLIEAARDGARKNLPVRGGLADRVAAATIRPKLTGAGSVSPRLRLEATQTGVSAARFKRARAADRRRARRRARG